MTAGAGPGRSQPLRAGIALAGLAAAGLGAGLLWWLDPARVTLFPPCPWHAVTGLLCPGCGTTRALHALLHGECGRAFRLNALSVSLLPLVLLGLLQQARPAWLPWLATPDRAPAWRIWTIFTLVVAFGVLRNLPFEPFNLLAPR